MSYQIEICANSVQSALNAEKGGADRVELCDNLWEGGTTPSHATIELAIQQLSIPVFVLIRPRGGDFVYTTLEFEIIKKDILHAKNLGAGGIVSGVLLPDGQIDHKRTAELVRLSEPLPFTFHRAFDQVTDAPQAMDELVKMGVKRILTSGQQPTVAQGMEVLNTLHYYANNRLVIMPGGGVNAKTIQPLYQLGFREFHFSAKVVQSGLANYSLKVPMNGSKDIPEDSIPVSDIETIRKMKKLLDEME